MSCLLFALLLQLLKEMEVEDEVVQEVVTIVQELQEEGPEDSQAESIRVARAHRGEYLFGHFIGAVRNILFFIAEVLKETRKKFSRKDKVFY